KCRTLVVEQVVVDVPEPHGPTIRVGNGKNGWPVCLLERAGRVELRQVGGDLDGQQKAFQIAPDVEENGVIVVDRPFPSDWHDFYRPRQLALLDQSIEGDQCVRRRGRETMAPSSADDM